MSTALPCLQVVDYPKAHLTLLLQHSVGCLHWSQVSTKFSDPNLGDYGIGAESRRMVEEAAAAAAKVQQENNLIACAHQIYERRNTKQMPAFPEPKRGKVHWDHVLEEMNWMAKEFSK